MTSAATARAVARWRRTTPYGDPAWFVESRFGVFLHWGLYSLAARHEWVQHREAVPADDYAARYFPRFDPDLYDPRRWARTIREAGAGYLVVTTKHHEGFALWDSVCSDFTAARSPAGRDLLGPLVDAARAEGLRVGLYHSLIDWHSQHFPVDGVHPLSRHPDRARLSGARDMARYREQLHGQVRELLTRFGHVDYLWFDYSYPHVEDGGKGAADWAAEDLERLCLELQPHLLLNDRLDLGRGVVTPEQVQPEQAPVKDGEPVLWEACQTLNGSWGYDRANVAWRSPEQLLWVLVDVVSKGGNLLLNVGPDARGRFGDRAEATLRSIGRWMNLNGRSVRGAGAWAGSPAPQDGRWTARGDRLYLHLAAWPYGDLRLPGLAGQIGYVQLLADASEIAHRCDGDDVVVRIPDVAPELLPGVLELFLT